MWEYQYEKETTARADQVWRVLCDLDSWASWDTSMEWVRLEGPFGVGTTVTMKPKGQEAITSVIVEVRENAVYADETEFAGVTLRFSHTLVPAADGKTRVVHRLAIAGPAADEVGPELGPAIVEDFPAAMDALLARAIS